MATGDQLLYLKLADALSRPSDAYLTAQEGINALKQAGEGYLQGQDIAESIRQRKLSKQTLSEALGGNVPDRVQPYSNLNVQTVEKLGGLRGLADITEPNKSNDWLTKFNMTQEAILKRQKDRQAFIEKMIGAKGNKDAINESQDALKASQAMQSLNDDLDKLGEGEARFKSSPAAKLFAPVLAAKKAQILLYAGFSRGGKQLTGTELGVVVNALAPTAFDDKESRHMKNSTFQDWADGKIDLMGAAKLLGPAGVPLAAIAQNQRIKREQETKNMLLGGGGSEDLNTLFSSEGL
jgi:hypothetical protein